VVELCGAITIGALNVSTTAAVGAARELPEIKVWLVVLVWDVLLVITSALPVVLPSVKLLRELPLNPMEPMFSGEEFGVAALIEIDVMFETTLNVAVSVFKAGLAGGTTPGKLPGVVVSVLQLFSAPDASQLPLVAVAFQAAPAAFAELGTRTAANATDAAEATINLR
jgi:hypothetical protein